MLSDKCQNRLFNWKFEQAIQYLDDQVTPMEKQTIEWLAQQYGNSGWFDGAASEGVSLFLEWLGVDEDE